ncbi:MAG: bifunctional 4-hydroxy-2-oxoglutarate aldolase/2-dehydro-3-deoxy-phosphogluconate aldolase [Planctomycetales bacterium]|nr:bifunctional 4-hydroxy-2-oxoglutarate aldolase/2-dehydro-3-deoxy-phosphogluconate aldolase [Planctomycetales bacterium]
MSKKIKALQQVLDSGIVAVIRADDGQQLLQVARALLAGGVRVMEVTFTVPRADKVIAEVADALGDQILLGAGTVLDAETARAAILAGAEFIVSPIVSPEVIQLCQRYDKAVMPGALTPTEVVQAWELGADIVKVFPADAMGPGYLKALHGPLPQVLLMPTGGVGLDNAAAYRAAGACALGVGSTLVSNQEVREQQFERIEAKARAFAELWAAGK